MTARKERVLVVDDSPQNRLVATGHLESAGYQVMAVGSGEEALELLAKERVDLVVLDVLMPGMGGFECCRRIRQTPGIAETPVLFLTALGDREAMSPALEAGGDDLLPKPFHRSELMLRVRALIRQRKTMVELKEALRAFADQNETVRRIEHDRRKMRELIGDKLTSPIGTVMANAELLKLSATGGQAQIVSEILVAAQQLDRTAKDLLDLSRGEAGDLTPSYESFSLTELVAEVVSTLRGMAGWTNNQLEIDVRTERATGDREMLRRMLQSLVHNAVKYAPMRTPVRIEAGVDSDGLLLRVLDHGPGVPAEEVKRLFERFVKLQDDPAGSGSHGLGLAFCRLAAEAHGGRIWVEDREGHGAAFCVRIPQPATPT